MPKEIILRDYQQRLIDSAREKFKTTNRVVMVAGTGAGKTLTAAWMMHNAKVPCAFIVDRITLIDQTSAVFDAYGISHGVIQASHWRYRPYERVQICSIQTLARRGFPENIKLLLADECHIKSKALIDFIHTRPDVKLLGLTATPFAGWMHDVYGGVASAVTTNQLIDGKHLCPVKVYVSKAVNTAGVKVIGGEWDENEITKRSSAIIGDVVSDWTRITYAEFGKPVKTIVFSASVAHGLELAQAFNAAGHRFELVSYKNTDEEKAELIAEFRKPDSQIVGIISCAMLERGFDVTDVQIGIGARPFRKSLSSYIQEFGRIRRTHPNKDYAVWICSAGNHLRFFEDMKDYDENGVTTLKEGKGKDDVVRKEPQEKEIKDMKCGQCSALMPRYMRTCTSCGWERPRRDSGIERVPGITELFDSDKFLASGKKMKEWMIDREDVYQQVVGAANSKYGINTERARKWSLAQYRNLYGEWPKQDYSRVTPKPASDSLKGELMRQMIAWAKTKGRNRRPSIGLPN